METNLLTTDQPLNISRSIRTSSQAKKAHRALIGKYIACKRCSEIDDENTSYIYLEDNRYRTRCVRCGDIGFLKLQHI